MVLPIHVRTQRRVWVVIIQNRAWQGLDRKAFLSLLSSRALKKILKKGSCFDFFFSNYQGMVSLFNQSVSVESIVYSIPFSDNRAPI